MAPKNCHQVLINPENTNLCGINFEKDINRLFLQGKCDDIVTKLVYDLGWHSEFEGIKLDYKGKNEGGKSS